MASACGPVHGGGERTNTYSQAGGLHQNQRALGAGSPQASLSCLR